jgi:predicted secreted protein
MGEVEVIRGDASSAKVALRGDLVRIEVAENPTTGYRWVLAPESAGLVDVEESRFEGPEAAKPGAGGLRRFALRLRGGARRGVIELRLARPWRPDEPVESIVVSVEL